MVEIINLRRARRRLAREAESQRAAVSRAVHGQTAAERLALGRAAARREAVLDGARVEDPAAGPAAGRGDDAAS